jgi:peroxiredoxin
MSRELPQSGKLVPPFTLAAQDGQIVRIGDFRGRRNLVLIFAARKPLSLISDMERRQAELQEENALVLLIDSIPNQFRAPNSKSMYFLMDSDSEVSRRFGAEYQAAVYITDQYGEIYSVHRMSEGSLLPDADEVLASLRHINAACPE